MNIGLNRGIFVRLGKWCRSSAEEKSSTQLTNKEGNGEATVKPPPAPKEAEAKPSAKPSAAASPPTPKVAAAGGAKKAAKAVAKPLPEMMVEDIIPKLTAYFENEKGVSDVEIKFDDNQVFEMFWEGDLGEYLAGHSSCEGIRLADSY